MGKMNKLPLEACVCGGKPDLDYTGCIDYKGSAYQTCMIHCDTCFRDATACFDSDERPDIDEMEFQVSFLWNFLHGKKDGATSE